MIKHLTTFFMLTLATFAFDNNYSAKISECVQKYNAHELSASTSKKVVSKETFIQESGSNITVFNKELKTAKDIKIFKTKKIEPINYTNTISLNNLQISEKKQKFFHMILPAILISKERLKQQRDRVLSLVSTPKDELYVEDREFLEDLYKKYKTKNNKKLLSRLKTHPVSIILAQAAIESAWGESRFFKKGNNIFGMWSYNRNEPRIKALGSRNGKAIYVKKYATLSDAIDDYFVVIGRGAYKSFREHREVTDNPLVLVQYLSNYCELGKSYTKKLKNFIVHNKLRKFDHYQIDSQYI